MRNKTLQDNTIVLGSCQDVASLISGVDVVLTSPFYNTSTKSKIVPREKLGNANQRGRYDTIVDTYTREGYCDFMVDLFNKMHDGLNDNAVVLFNISYSTGNPDGYMFALSDIIRRTEYTLVDQIAWKKPVCIPDISTPNRLSRIVEPIYVFCKKGFEKTHYCNKPEISQGAASHRCYKPMYNFVEAMCGNKEKGEKKCPYNAATYSIELCVKLLGMYAPKNALVYDPFMGSGTTAVACKRMGLRWLGSEISENQVKWAEDRLNAIPSLATDGDVGLVGQENSPIDPPEQGGNLEQVLKLDGD
jgi:DNA modification methylase